MPTNGFETLNGNAYDKKGSCKKGNIPGGTQFKCFPDLTTFCNNPI